MVSSYTITKPPHEKVINYNLSLIFLVIFSKIRQIMKSKNKQKRKKPVKQRRQYTPEEKRRAKKYYLIGLNLHEISKLLDGVPVRTLEKWQKNDNWTGERELKNIKLRALELKEGGKSYSEISEILEISRVTVWRYIKEAEKITIEQ